MDVNPEHCALERTVYWGDIQYWQKPRWMWVKAARDQDKWEQDTVRAGLDTRLKPWTDTPVQCTVWVLQLPFRLSGNLLSCFQTLPDCVLIELYVDFGQTPSIHRSYHLLRTLKVSEDCWSSWSWANCHGRHQGWTDGQMDEWMLDEWSLVNPKMSC